MKRLHRHALTIGQRTVYTLLACLLVSAGWSEELDTLRFEYQPEKDIKELNLPKMYKLVDDAIEQAEHYIADYESKLYKTKQAIAESSDDHQKLALTLDLSLMYESFNGDSTLAYTVRALQMASELGLPEVVADCQARMAYLCTFLGSQTESLTLLQRIDKSALTQDGLCNYYRSYMMVYGNLGGNCQINPAQKPYSDYLGRRSVATVYILCHRFVLSLQAAKATESGTPAIGRHQQTSGRNQRQTEMDERLGEQKQCRMAGRKQETEGENT
mgnify:CR=1 FL=1